MTLNSPEIGNQLKNFRLLSFCRKLFSFCARFCLIQRQVPHAIPAVILVVSYIQTDVAGTFI